METAKPPQKIATDKSTSTQRKLLRQQSITRGTASSRAKAVKPVVIVENNNIQQRRLSVRVRNQSLTHMETNRLLLAASTSNSVISQRRSSWSTLERMPSSTLLEISSPLKKTTPDRPIVNGSTISSSNSSSSSVSTRVHSSCSKKDTMVTKPGLYKNDKDNDNALPHAEDNQQKQVNHEDPLETSVVVPEEEVSETHNHEEDDLPGYMRRPICAACNRNVKISDSSSSVSVSSASQKSSIHKREINTSPSSSEDIMVMVRTRSNSPTSPIPTRRSSGRRLDELMNYENNKEKWNELLIQQQKIIEFVNMDSDNMMMLSSVEYTPGDETLILETQVELLKRFESLLLLSSLPVPQLVTTPLPVVDENEQERPLPIASWQTQFEYRLTRFKWNISQWFGTLVGDGQIEEQEFDTLGYTKTVVISGVCVTTEPGLLPKNLQKYYPNRGQLVCHKYLVHLDRQKRLTLFSLLNNDEWKKDTSVKACEFHVNGLNCNIEFNVFHRRHHCRSCGHLFCQTHCSNRLPLFISNGEERGEWSRVCDTCFYARIDPQFIARC
ncbi:uncharacterized protein EV154DRAFT_218861 [Mucor mucedo]|uniref:uncharacterized protein n=1 Tax=Mucor mucedo TaxID=29922 RepID=UPI0022210C81|nr:uncharacterized protein EV154DRAFT_218861 [Mucor mucedo]KAI7891657.1 hypothetical protein EV154DRAFT_218861 [Mucor mucedo]